MPERILHDSVIIKIHIAGFRLGERRFIKAIADVNALHIVYKRQYALKTGVRRRVLFQQIIHVIISEIAVIIPRGRRFLIVNISLDSTSGRVDSPVENLAQAGHGRAARAGG